MSFPEHSVRGEIRKIVRHKSGPVEVLLRVRGRRYDPERHATFIHVRALDHTGRTVGLERGAEVCGRIRMTARFLEENRKPERSLEVDGRPGAGRIPKAIRVVGHDARIVGEVVGEIDPETIALDAGIPLIVRIPDPSPSLPPVGQFIEFLLQDPVEFALV